MTKKAVVFGGSGFIGNHVVANLLEQGYQVVIADQQASQPYSHLWQACDICVFDDVLRASRDCDVIYHLAAVHRDDVKPIQRYYQVNVDGTKNICRAAEKNGINKIIFTSSVAIYGLPTGRVAEDYQPQPFNDYGQSKWQAEQVLQKWQQQNQNASCVIVRPTAVFGKGNRGNIYNLMHQIAKGPFIMIGDGNNIKSIAYVENVAAFLVYALSFTEGLHHYNYVDTPDLTVKQLVMQIKNALGDVNSSFLKLPLSLGVLIGSLCDMFAFITKRTLPLSRVRVKKFVANTVFSAEKALNTGFIPPVPIENALNKTVSDEFLN